MRVYELMIIFDSDVDDSGLQQMLNRVNEMVSSGKGKVASTDRWGRRRFAYEINHKLEGYYVVLEIVTENEEIKGASITVRQRVLRGDEELISALVQVAFVSGGRARPIPKALRIAMQSDKDAASRA